MPGPYLTCRLFRIQIPRTRILPNAIPTWIYLHEHPLPVSGVAARQANSADLAVISVFPGWLVACFARPWGLLCLAWLELVTPHSLCSEPGSKAGGEIDEGESQQDHGQWEDQHADAEDSQQAESCQQEGHQEADDP